MPPWAIGTSPAKPFHKSGRRSIRQVFVPTRTELTPDLVYPRVSTDSIRSCSGRDSVEDARIHIRTISSVHGGRGDTTGCSDEVIPNPVVKWRWWIYNGRLIRSSAHDTLLVSRRQQSARPMDATRVATPSRWCVRRRLVFAQWDHHLDAAILCRNRFSTCK